MNIWGAITGLFAGPGTAATVVKDVAAGIDSAVFTDQEKAKWFLDYLNATLPQNRARRLIACAFVYVFVALVVSVVVVWPFSHEYAAFILGTIKDTLATPVSVVMAFYFIKRMVAK